MVTGQAETRNDPTGTGQGGGRTHGTVSGARRGGAAGGVRREVPFQAGKGLRDPVPLLAEPVEHLRGFAGILQADALAGYNRLHGPGRSPGPVTEAACFAQPSRRVPASCDPDTEGWYAEGDRIRVRIGTNSFGRPDFEWRDLPTYMLHEHESRAVEDFPGRKPAAPRWRFPLRFARIA